jgi:hypothetical protein
MLRGPATPIRGTQGATLLDFWQWAYSDILSNRNRAVFAEFLVGRALDCLQRPRIEWDAVDLRYKGSRIEVKSAAAVQSWAQRRPSRVTFGIAGTKAWDAATGATSPDAHRNADLYVFCHFTELSPEKAGESLLDTRAWEFYVLPTSELERNFPNAKSLSLSVLRRLVRPVSFSSLRDQVDAVLANNGSLNTDCSQTREG